MCESIIHINIGISKCLLKIANKVFLRLEVYNYCYNRNKIRNRNKLVQIIITLT